MSYKLNISEENVFGESKFMNSLGHTECVEFVRQATGAPQTAAWKKGAAVFGSTLSAISRGTAIATFNDSGKYPTDGKGRHAAIYLNRDTLGIRVLDQWNSQGEVLERVIHFSAPSVPRSNSGKSFYVVE